jgi:hypothetical protein
MPCTLVIHAHPRPSQSIITRALLAADQYTSRAWAGLMPADSAQAPATRLAAIKPRTQGWLIERLGRVETVRDLFMDTPCGGAPIGHGRTH